MADSMVDQTPMTAYRNRSRLNMVESEHSTTSWNVAGAIT
jgi:hypothetical protein